jgi:hypothetical protein
LREEHRLRVSENRGLRRIFGPKREEDGSCRKLHNDELHNLYSSPNIVRVIKSRRMRWVGHVARMGEGRGFYSVLVGKSEGKRPVGRPRRRREDNIKIYMMSHNNLKTDADALNRRRGHFLLRCKIQHIHQGQ